MRKAIVFGSNGLLGQNIIKKFSGHYSIYASSLETDNYNAELTFDYRQIDLTVRSQVKSYIEEIQPDLIINAAAYTDVDKAEVERELCWNVNVRAVDNIIESSVFIKPIIIQISSDYVFDGTEAPYREIDKPNPRGNYARSKMASENIVRSSKLEYILCRTQILYGKGQNVRPNFVTWVIDQLKRGKPVRIVGDQIGSPTYAPDLCEAIFRLLQNEAYGLFHVSGPDSISRYDFSLKIADVFGLDRKLITKITTDELNQQSPRPMDSTFVIDKLVNHAHWEPHDCAAALKLLKNELEAGNG